MFGNKYKILSKRRMESENNPLPKEGKRDTCDRSDGRIGASSFPVAVVAPVAGFFESVVREGENLPDKSVEFHAWHG